MLRQVQAESERLRLNASARNSAEPRRRGFRRRLKIALAASAGYWAIRLVGRTIRWETEGLEHLDAIHASGQAAIFAFWHGRIVPATWYFRGRGIVVMISMNVDGEMIARVIERLGYATARGSSSRGGFRALAEMAAAVRRGRDVGFSVDGPRGPRHVAKPGAAILARETGAAIFCFHVAMKRKLQLRSWDRFQVPLPFTRARVFGAPPIRVDAGAGSDAVRAARERMQAALDALRERGDGWEAAGRRL